MNMNVRKILVAGALALASSVAVAGAGLPVPVDVDLGASVAQGDMRSGRNDKDKEVYIGCGVRVFDDGGGSPWAFGFCQAADADGDAIACLTESPHLLSAMGASSDSSYIQFEWINIGPEPDDNQCTHVGISTQSFYLKKGH
jgi:hypothetical protein